MTGKSYYITTLADWHRHAARFANSHWIALASRAPDPLPTEENGVVGARHAVPGAALPESINVQDGPFGGDVAEKYANVNPSLTVTDAGFPSDCQASMPGMACHAPTGETATPLHADAKILVLVEADEGVHLALEGEPAFEALPHPLAQKPISDAAQSALAPHGVAPGGTTFDAAEAVARVHPLLRHRVF